MNIERLKRHTIVQPNGCWEWTRSCSSSGYGQITEDGKYWSTHVYSWVAHNRPVSPGEVVRHNCHNKKCWNPDHLEIGTYADNYEDSRDVHIEVAVKARHKWSVYGVEYPTCRAAVAATGISTASMVKYTKDGIFDAQAYEVGCIKGKRR
jgi:hypothetical protein